MDDSLNGQRCVLLGAGRDWVERFQKAGAAVWVPPQFTSEPEKLTQVAHSELGGVDTVIVAVEVPSCQPLHELVTAEFQDAMSRATRNISHFVRYWVASKQPGGIVAVLHGDNASWAGSVMTGAILGLVRYTAATYAPRGIRANALLAAGDGAIDSALFLASDAAKLVTGAVLPVTPVGPLP